MASDVLVSVYLPTRNRETLLRRAVDSVLDQTYPSIELIVVNDGSSDETFDYLEALARQDPRVAVIHNASCLGRITFAQSGDPGGERRIRNGAR